MAGPADARPHPPGRAAAQITAEQREPDAGIAKRARDAEDAVRRVPQEFRFTDPPGEEGK
jgi:hypothetical protein